MLKKDFSRSVPQEESGAAIGTKLTPPYACTVIERFEISFLEIQFVKPLVWFRNIDKKLFYLDA